MPSSPPSTAAPTHSEAWLAAIGSAERKRRRDPSDAADYLRHLNDALHGHGRARWNEPPAFPPPPPRWEQRGRHEMQGNDAFDPYAHQPQYAHHVPNFGASPGDEALVDAIATSLPRLAVSSSDDAPADRNPYSIFGAGDDDGSDDSSDDDEISDEEIVYHAATQPSPNNNDSTNEASWADEAHMSTRRILLRVHCALAEIHSQRAVACSKSRRWTEGADEFEVAFRTILSGQELLDEEHAYLAQIVEVLDNGNVNENNNLEREVRRRKEGIAKDSEVVAVPLAFFAASRDKYVRAAQARIAYLEDKLYENKATRREVMASMGDHRWKNNPSPSHDYAARRKVLERELDEALEGMNRTSRMDVGEVGGR